MNRRWSAVIVLSFVGVAAGSSQSTDLSRIMREKLVHAEKLLEGVVTSNWSELEQHSREMDRLTDDPRWTALKYPEYARYSLEFKQAVQGLHAAAVQHDQEETPRTFTAVTMACVDCHRYLARARIAK